MKKLHLSLLFLLAVITAGAQKVYFVYIQAETEQPFFVKMNDKVSSSTASGYIILSKLVDSTYNFSIGFPQNKWPEQQFSVALNKKDQGFLLKNFGEKGWGLFNLQTLAVQMSNAGKASADVKTVEDKTVSRFTEILSKAADDPSLKEKPVIIAKVEEKKNTPVVEGIAKKEEPKQEPKETVVVPAEEKPAVVKTEEPKPEQKEPVEVKREEVKPVLVSTETPKPEQKETGALTPVEPAATIAITEEKKEQITAEAKTEIKEDPQAPYKPSQVKKWAESSTTDGFGLVFIDGDANGNTDTIRLVIPNPNPAVTLVKEEPKDDKPFIKTSELPANNAVVDEVKKETIQAVQPTTAAATVEPKTTNEATYDPTALTKSITRTNCREVATGDDFVKLRKQMASVMSDDDMIGEAKKYFKTKCFSTWQLKHLGVMFLNDEGKYKFFDAAYAYVTDPQAFSSLQSEIRDEYYLGRFKAMLRN